MDEQKLNSLLKNVPNYQGSFAANELNQVKISDQNLIVINFDERKDQGSHWIGLKIDLKYVYICDSLGGIAPTKYQSQGLINFLYLLSRTRNIVITKQLQPIDSSLCGLYAVTFIREMNNGSFEDFLRLFTNDYRTNDEIVRFLTRVYK